MPGQWGRRQYCAESKGREQCLDDAPHRIGGCEQTGPDSEASAVRGPIAIPHFLSAAFATLVGHAHAGVTAIVTLGDDRSLQLEHGKNFSRKERAKKEDEFTIDFRGLVALVYSIVNDEEPDEVNIVAEAWFPFDPDHRFSPTTPE